MCLSVVDPSKLKTAEFVYLISEYAGKLSYTQAFFEILAHNNYEGDDEENVNKYIEVMQKMYSTARKMKLSSRETVAAEIDN